MIWGRWSHFKYVSILRYPTYQTVVQCCSNCWFSIPSWFHTSFGVLLQLLYWLNGILTPLSGKARWRQLCEYLEIPVLIAKHIKHGLKPQELNAGHGWFPEAITKALRQFLPSLQECLVELPQPKVVDVLREARKIPPENLALHLADLIWHFAGCQSAVQAVGGMLRGLDVNDIFLYFLVGGLELFLFSIIYGITG